MAQLLLASVGAAIGSTFGFPGLGWAAGSIAGSLLFGSERTVRGPQLADLRVQRSEYGATVPITLGTPRIAGILIDASDLRPTTTGESVGKGGGGTTIEKTTYSVDLDILICRGPKRAVRRIWWNGRLVYNVSADATPDEIEESLRFAQGFKFYRGTEDELPDPTFEALHGVGNVPGYRGWCRIVFTALQLAEVGNTVGNFEFEVLDEASDTWLRVLDDDFQLPTNMSSVAYRADHLVVAATTKVAASDTVETRYGVSYFYDARPVETWRVLHVSAAGDYWSFGDCGNMPGFSWFMWSNGEHVAQTPSFWLDALKYLPGVGWGHVSGAISNLFGGELAESFPLTDKRAWFGRRQNRLYAIQFSAHGGAYLSWWQVKPGYTRPGGTPDKSVSLGDFSAHWTPIVDEITGRLYVGETVTGVIRRLDPDTLQTLDSWSVGGICMSNGYHVYGGVLAFQGWDYSIEAWRLNDGGTLDHLQTIPWMNTPVEIRPTNAGVFVANGPTVSVFQIASALTPPDRTLADLVTLLCLQSGYAAGEFDASDLAAVKVRSYALAQQTTGAAALSALAPVYGFDMFEADGKLRFVRRYPPQSFELKIDDLVASEDPISVPRAKETDLPRDVTVRFFNVGADYQLGAQPSKRQATTSLRSEVLDAPVGLTDAEAAAIADRAMYRAWAGRESYRFALPITHLARTPTDVGTIQTDTGAVTVQINRITLDGIELRCEATAVDSGMVTPHVGAQMADGGQQVLNRSRRTEWELLDTVSISDAHADSAKYVIAGDTGTAPIAGWPGAAIYRSDDAGATWHEAGALVSAGVIGVTQDALPDSPVAWVDEAHALRVKLRNGTLTSCTHLQMLAGQNACAVGSPAKGWEIIFFRDAVLADDIWTLTGLLRGACGSEQFTGIHTSSDTFVLLSDAGIEFMDAVATDRGTNKLFRAVTYGALLSAGSDKSIDCEVTNLKPLAPDHIAATLRINGDIVISARRRDRKMRGWHDLIDTPLSETSETYDISLYDINDELMRTIVGTTLPYTYTSALQTSDHGWAPRNFLVTLAQRSAAVGRGFERTARVLTPRVFGPRDYEDGVIPSDQILSSANGSQAPGTQNGRKCMVLTANANVWLRCKFASIGEFKNGLIEVDAYLSSGFGAFLRTTAGFAEANSLAWYVRAADGVWTLSRGTDGAGAATVIATASATTYAETIRFRLVAIGSRIQLWSGSPGNLIKRIDVTDALLNQAGAAGVLSGGYAFTATNYLDNVRIENWD